MADTEFNFFGLIKKAAVVLDLDEPVTFEDTEQTEYKKLKNALNSMNRSIVLMEAERWSFRDQEVDITLIEGVSEYDRPEGLIYKLTREDATILIPEYTCNYPITGTGNPERYRVFADKIILYPIPDATNAGKLITIEFATDMCAKTVGGVLKYNMELETDYSLIPTQYSDALIFGTCRDYKAMPDRSKYQHYNSRYTQEIRQMRSKLKRSNQLEPYNDVYMTSGSNRHSSSLPQATVEDIINYSLRKYY